MRIWLPMVLLAACGGPSSPPEPSPDAAADAAETPLGDIGDELRAIPGMTVEEREAPPEGYRFFVLTYDQPVDHDNPGTRFTQRMTLLHRDYAAPVVVQNSGYNVSTGGRRSQVTQIIDGNQLSMEHRFFLPSRPDPADWSQLTIAQAAADQHRITQTLKSRIYSTNKFLTTGASKGGMTSLFHKRFYPDDVDGTIAYVAPLDFPADTVQSPTNRYITFLENVGTDPGCRQKLKDFQNTVLARRNAIKTRMRAEATYTAILGEDRALEFAALELPFIFWQYGDQSRCSEIPNTAATDDAVFAFLDDTLGVATYGDDEVLAYLPYYHQSATQLAYPIGDESYLVGLQFPGGDTAAAYIPAGISVPPYDDGAAMTDVQSWIATSGAHIMLIYGQNDPWSAGAVSLGEATDSFKFIAPGGNHGSSIADLVAGEQNLAVETILRWADVTGMAKPHPAERTLEADEFDRRHR